MPGATHHIDFEEVRRSAVQLKKAKEEVEGRLKTLKSMIDGLVTKGFVTEKATAKFQESYRQWDTGAKNVMAGLEGMSGFLEKAIAEHQQLDTKLTQSTGGG